MLPCMNESVLKRGLPEEGLLLLLFMFCLVGCHCPLGDGACLPHTTELREGIPSLNSLLLQQLLRLQVLLLQQLLLLNELLLLHQLLLKDPLL